MKHPRNRDGVERFLVTRISTGEEYRCTGRSIEHAERKAAAHWGVTVAQVMGYDTSELEEAPPSSSPISLDRIILCLTARMTGDREVAHDPSGQRLARPTSNSR